MSDKQLLKDPTNRIVAVFENKEHAEAARHELREAGLSNEDIRIFHGTAAAENLATSAKWFADTDVDIKRFQRQLKSGNTVMSLPIESGDLRETVHGILKRHNARFITHFGQWITELME